MIDRFHLKNYRGFTSCEVQGLTNVNLFVGKNNAGKTSILEAIHLYTSNAPIGVVQNIATRRGEQVVQTCGVPPSVRIVPDVRHLFFGHQIRDGLVMEMGSPAKTFSMQLTQTVKDVHLMDAAALQMLRSRNAVVLSVYQRNESAAEQEVGIVTITPEGEITEYRKHSPEIDKDAVPPSVFVSPESADYGFLSNLWNDVLRRGDEQSIVNALQILNPDLKSIAFLLFDHNAVRAFASTIPGIVVGVEGFDHQRIPLGSLGDGSKRLLAIALAISAAKNGYLFIDEIDVGLHYSTMDKLWGLIIDTALKNNVQVFASTHSLDCLRGLDQAIAENADRRKSVALHAVMAGEKSTTSYTGDEVSVAVRQEIEVR